MSGEKANLPNPNLLLEDNPGKCALLLGNEAIVRAILETGISIVTTYPGTPASEIGDTASKLAMKAGLYMEYSTNEIVAVEVAAGAANCGIRALTAMKHVGLNVAADALMTLAYVGVKGGYVIATADDPECYSSQNEQDNRYYALLSNLPCLEPSDPQEAKDMTVTAIELSERLELPVLLRTTTRVNHTRSPVTYGKLQKPRSKGEFFRDSKRMVMIPAFARSQHTALLEKANKAKELSEISPHNRIAVKGSRDVGLISSGSAYNYAAEANNILKINASILKLGMTHPLPENLITDFLKSHKKIVVVEELEPFLETQIKATAKDHSLNAEICGKMNTPYFPRKGELSTRSVLAGLAGVLKVKSPLDFQKIEAKFEEASKGLPSRPPILCPGCPHRASFYVMKRAGGTGTLYPTDIGCYALGVAPPLEVGDILICMGSSISTAQGINRATGRNTVAIVGDSTFFHSTIPGLVNAVYNNAKVVLVVLDNETTAMTGNQPHPGTGLTGMQTPAEKISIEEVAKGIGVKYVRVVNPFETKKAEATIREALSQNGPSVVIFRALCALISARERRLKGVTTTVCTISDACTSCMVCVKLLGCPALTAQAGRVQIDESLCSGCGLCISVCPYNAIRGGDED